MKKIDLSAKISASICAALIGMVSCSSVETKRPELSAPPTRSLPPPAEAPVLATPPMAQLPPAEIQAAPGAYYSEDPYTIGTILPLTGRNARLGQKVLRSLQMGLGLGKDPKSRFKLVIYDSEGEPEIAAQRFDEMISKDKPIAFVGPLLSRNAVTVAEKAQSYRIPAIALSQKSKLTDVGPFVFRNALSSSMQIEALLQKAMGEMGLRRFAIIYPNEAYGIEYANVFWDQVLIRGGEITAAQTYDPQQTDFKETIQRVVGHFYPEPRMAEYNLKLKELNLQKQQQQQQQARSRKNNTRQEEREDILPPIVNFDAVFIPDSAKNFGQVVSFLAYSRVKGVKVLGTNLLNTPGLSRRLGTFASELAFVDIPNEGSSFSEEYQKNFGEPPGLLEVHAYESAVLLKQVISEGARSRTEVQRRLSQVNQFTGVNAMLNMTSSRELSRQLQTYRIEKTEIVPY